MSCRWVFSTFLKCFPMPRVFYHSTHTRLRFLDLLYDITVLLRKTINTFFSVFYTLVKHGFLTIHWQWPHGYCTRLRSKRARFSPWPRTLCWVLGQDTLLSQCLSLPRSINRHCMKLRKPNKLCGSDSQWTSIPSRGSRNTSSCFMLQKPG